MQIAIPHQNHSSTQHLRYALRSIEKYHPTAEVTLVGDLPVWVRNVKHIPHKDDTGLQWKERNIFKKMLLVPYERFVVFHDDHYLLKPLTKTKYKKDVGDYRGNYAVTMKNTFNIVGECDYDTHIPFWVDRSKLRELCVWDWSVQYGYAIQTLYSRAAGLSGKLIEDVKIRGAMRREEIFAMIKGKPAFSSCDTSFQGEMRSVLVTLFPDKCKFEV